MISNKLESCSLQSVRILQLKRGLFWYWHHPQVHEAVSYGSSRAKHLTDCRNLWMHIFVVVRQNISRNYNNIPTDPGLEITICWQGSWIHDWRRTWSPSLKPENATNKTKNVFAKILFGCPERISRFVETEYSHGSIIITGYLCLQIQVPIYHKLIKYYTCMENCMRVFESTNSVPQISFLESCRYRKVYIFLWGLPSF